MIAMQASNIFRLPFLLFPFFACRESDLDRSDHQLCDSYANADRDDSKNCCNSLSHVYPLSVAGMYFRTV